MGDSSGAGRVVAPFELAEESASENHGVQAESSVAAEPEATTSEGVTLRARVLSGGEPVRDRKLELKLFCLGHRPGEATTGTTQQVEGRRWVFTSAVSTSEGEGRIQWGIDPVARPDFLHAIRVTELSQGAMGWSEEDHVPLPGSSIDLGTIEIGELRERYPIPLITGVVRNELDQPVPEALGWATPEFNDEVVENENRRQHPRDAWDAQVTIAADGSFAVYGDRNVLGVFLTIDAPKYHGFNEWIEPPEFGYVARLSKKIIWRGQLIVPEEGPKIESYGVWLMEGGSGTGVLVHPDGHFEAIGRSSSAELSVTFPNIGAVLHREATDVTRIDLSADSTELTVHEIDLRGRIRILDMEFVTAAGTATSDTRVQIGFPEGAAMWPRHQFDLDEQGHLQLVVPLDLEWLELRPKNGDRMRHPLGSLPYTILWPQ